MAGHKRASMREGPLAQLFRRTEGEEPGPEGAPEPETRAAAPLPAEPIAERRPPPPPPPPPGGADRGAPPADAAGAPARGVLLRDPRRRALPAGGRPGPAGV